MSLQLLESTGKSSLGTVRKNPMKSWLDIPQLSSGPAGACHLCYEPSVVAGSLINMNTETDKPSLNHSIISAELMIQYKGTFPI